jgi:rhamnulokinase
VFFFYHIKLSIIRDRKWRKGMERYYLAIDIGASSGRHILGHIEDGKMVLEEIYRFPNGMTEKNGTLCWDVERLFTEIKNGLKVCKELGKISVRRWRNW